MQFLHPNSATGVVGAAHLAQWACSGGGSGGSASGGDQGNGSLGVEPSTSLSIALAPIHLIGGGGGNNNNSNNNNNAGSNSVGQSTFSLNSMITCTTGEREGGHPRDRTIFRIDVELLDSDERARKEG